MLALDAEAGMRRAICALPLTRPKISAVEVMLPFDEFELVSDDAGI